MAVAAVCLLAHKQLAEQHPKTEGQGHNEEGDESQDDHVLGYLDVVRLAAGIGAIPPPEGNVISPRVQLQSRADAVHHLLHSDVPGRRRHLHQLGRLGGCFTDTAAHIHIHIHTQAQAHAHAGGPIRTGDVHRHAVVGQ